MASLDQLLENYKNVVTTAASVAASAMLFRGVVNDLVPYEVRDMVFSGLRRFRLWGQAIHTIVVEDVEGYANNKIYDAVRAYLASKIDMKVQRLKVSQTDEVNNMLISMEDGEEMSDFFNGIEFKWHLVCRENSRGGNGDSNGGGGFSGRKSSLESRAFELDFPSKHKDVALKSYLPFILKEAKAMKEKARSLRIFLNDGDMWNPVDLRHPSTFETLAMDTELKRALMDDLARFVKRKDYYKKIGKAWKRGYLLYGPPGTGKSSLIAAMANYLKFDIYDLELSDVRWNSNLRRLLIGLENKSILVIEDIDCTVGLKRRDNSEENKESRNWDDDTDRITLSGLLNFIDGLWSTSGEERIIIFTTNYKDRLDPALLRPGRMDMHVYMGYCRPDSFRTLASNYHSIDDHALFPEIESLIIEVEATPAEVAEALMRSDDVDIALRGLLNFLQEKKTRADENDRKKLTGIDEENKSKTVEKQPETTAQTEMIDPSKESSN